MSRGMITSIDTVTQVFIKFQKRKKANKNMGISKEQNTKKTYENGDKCVQIWKRRGMCIYVQIHICSNPNDKHADRKGGQTWEQGNAYINSTVTKVSIEFAGKKKENTTVVMITKLDTNHEREADTHT